MDVALNDILGNDAVYQQFQYWLNQFMWPFTRIGAFFMVAPIIGAQVVFARIRMILAILLTALLLPVLPEMPKIEAFSLQGMLVIVHQLLLGVAMGFVLQVFLQVFILAGQMMAMKMGLGFALMVDPSNGISVPIVSQFYIILVTLLFLASNGHLVMIEVMVDSFQTMPVGVEVSAATLQSVARMGTWLFASGILLSLPIITALLIVNMAFGVMSRAAPQLNIFALGFPFTLTMGLVTLWVLTEGLLPQYNFLAEQAFEYMRATFTY